MLIDVHTHMDHYGQLLSQAMEDITKHRIFTVATSMDNPSYQKNLYIGKTNPLIMPTFGIHPWNAHEFNGELEDLKPFIDQSPMLGEIGLDHHFIKDPTTYGKQRRILEFFLKTAGKQRKVVNLHTKGAELEILDILDTYDVGGVIIHWYSGPIDIFRKLIERGYYFTVSIEVSHSSYIRSLASEIPEDRLLTETDNPGGNKWLTATPGMPGQIRDVVTSLAELKKTTSLSIEQRVQENFMRLMDTGDPLPEEYLSILQDEMVAMEIRDDQCKEITQQEHRNT